MADPDPHQHRLQRLRGWRNTTPADAGMGFLARQFKAEVEKPYRQLSALVGLWEKLLPPDLLPHTRLEALDRGVLRVSVDSSARLYELDRLLRGGLESELVAAHKGPAFRKVRLKVGKPQTPPLS